VGKKKKRGVEEKKTGALARDVLVKQGAGEVFGLPQRGGQGDSKKNGET